MARRADTSADPARPAAVSSTEITDLTADAPRLAAIVVSFSPESSLARCLEALTAQAGPHDGIEVVVVRARRGGQGSARQAIGDRYPAVRFVDAPEGCTVPRMRAIGVAESRAPVIALIEDDCVVGPGWAEAVLRAHRAGAAAVGGAVEPATFRRGLDWGVFFCDYGRFMPPLGEGPAVAVAGNNMSYARDALRAMPEIATEGLQEVFVCGALRARGLEVRTSPAILVTNSGNWSWEHVTRVPFHHARAYAGKRIERAGSSRRAAMGVLALGLPAVKVLRVSREALARRRVGPWLRGLPWIVLLAASWSLGESAGYLLGAGDSASRWQ